MNKKTLQELINQFFEYALHGEDEPEFLITTLTSPYEDTIPSELKLGEELPYLESHARRLGEVIQDVLRKQLGRLERLSILDATAEALMETVIPRSIGIEEFEIECLESDEGITQLSCDITTEGACESLFLLSDASEGENLTNLKDHYIVVSWWYKDKPNEVESKQINLYEYIDRNLTGIYFL